LKSQPLRKNRQKRPCIDAVKEHLEHAIDRYKSGDVIGVPFSKLVPYQHHCNAACNADQDQTAHISRFVAQEEHRESKHQDRADQPVLHKRQPKDAPVAEDLAQLLVAHLCQRRKHHHDQADGNWNVCRPGLKTIDERGRAGDEVSDAHADAHR
jgi:hypothetical protein